MGNHQVLVVIRRDSEFAKVYVNLGDETGPLVEALEWAGGELAEGCRPGDRPAEVLIPRDRIQFGVNARGV